MVSNCEYFSEISRIDGKNYFESSEMLEDAYLKNALPYFDTIMPQNVSAVVGKTAFLTCVVKNLKPTQKVSQMSFDGVVVSANSR